MSRFDPGALVAALVDGGVDFLVVGGFAVVAHGFERATGDVDIVPSPNRQNLERLEATLHAIDARVLGAGDFDQHEMPLDLTVDNLQLLGNWRLETRFGVLDLLQSVGQIVDGQGQYDELNARAVRAHFAGREVLIVGYEDLLAMKVIAGRDQDMIDIRALREANDDTAP